MAGRNSVGSVLWHIDEFHLQHFIILKVAYGHADWGSRRKDLKPTNKSVGAELQSPPIRKKAYARCDPSFDCGVPLRDKGKVRRTIFRADGWNWVRGRTAVWTVGETTMGRPGADISFQGLGDIRSTTI